MSTAISSTSSPSTLASALLSLASQSPNNTAAPSEDGADSSSSLDLDSLQLSGSSLSSLETTAQTIAAQNQNSVIATSEAALAANLKAIAALFANPASAQGSQASADAAQVLKLVS